MMEVLANAIRGDAHGVGDFLGGGAVWAGGQVGEEFAEVGLASGGGCGLSRGRDSDGQRAEQHQLGQVAARIEPRADVVIERRVVLFKQLADAARNVGGEGGQVVGDDSRFDRAALPVLGGPFIHDGRLGGSQ